MPDKPTRKVIATDADTGRLYEKIARAMTKQPAQVGTVFVKDAARVMALEFIQNHPELGVKA